MIARRGRSLPGRREQSEHTSTVEAETSRQPLTEQTPREQIAFQSWPIASKHVPVPCQVIATAHFSTMASSWTEYLCMEVCPDGRVELSSQGHEVLGYGDWFDGEVVWPEGFDPEKYDPEEGGDMPLPVSVGGQKIIQMEDGAYLGEGMRPHSDDSTTTFQPGEVEEAREWLASYYKDAHIDDFPTAWAKVEEALRQRL